MMIRFSRPWREHAKGDEFDMQANVARQLCSMGIAVDVALDRARSAQPAETATLGTVETAARPPANTRKIRKAAKRKAKE